MAHNVATESGAISGSRTDLERMATEIGSLCVRKEQEYGSAVYVTTEIMRALYPGGIRSHQMGDALLLVRIADKMCRIASRDEDGDDKGGESPYEDIAGYGLLGARKDRDR